MRQFMRTCNNRLGGWLGWLVDFAKSWNAVFLFAGLLLLWKPLEALIWLYDPMAAPFDIGVMFASYQGAINYAGFSLLIWLNLKFFSPLLFRFWQGLDPKYDSFIKVFNNDLTGWQKILSLLGFLALQYFFCAFCLVAASK